MYNDESDIDAAVNAINAIINKEYKGKFIKKGEDYVPAEWSSDYFDDYVNVEAIVNGKSKSMKHTDSVSNGFSNMTLTPLKDTPIHMTSSVETVHNE